MSDYEELEEEEYKTQITGKTLFRIAAMIKPHWKWVAGFLGAIAFVSVIDSFVTYLGKRIIDEGIAARNADQVVHLLTINAGITLFQAIMVFFFIYLVAILGEKVRFDLRKMMFNHLQDLSLSYYSRKPVGWIMARVTSDSDRVADLMTWGVLDTTWAVINIITAIFFMISINWQMALVVVATIPVLVFISIKFRKRILLEYRTVRKMNSKITGSFNENITGVRVVKALNREEENLREFSQLTDQMYRSSYKAAWISALLLPTVQMVSAIALTVVILSGGKQVEFGGMTIGGIQAFISYITFMMWPVQDMARIYAEMQHAVASAERIFGLVDTVPEVQNRPDAIGIQSIKGDIVFENVDFYYEPEKPVLTHFSLSIKQGETIALVGPTGGGKTTIVNLVCRFYEPKNGRITIGGQDYLNFKLEDIQSRVGIVLQTPHLFSGTIRENIRYGRLNATDEEVEQAAHIAGAHDFILTLDKGYDQNVGESGNLLSVGQKQLISLARAVLSDPEIFIMDEATSSVDTLTESLIQKGMETIMKGRTSFVIAHRLSTIRRADKIVVVDDGGIAEIGTHNELLRKRGQYYQLYTRQFRQEKEDSYDPFAVPEPVR
ncbi:MAG TPA: ABC transporter ATP-binding protein [Anaerolineaceae bacterium]|nr:ABC transporter ATP-binding protein [Anaerolineaceae bacterium]HPN52741.1 ABC transporter ATP-binding protein [Anaerolineaceae bacterium]